MTCSFYINGYYFIGNANFNIEMMKVASTYGQGDENTKQMQSILSVEVAKRSR